MNTPENKAKFLANYIGCDITYPAWDSNRKIVALLSSVGLDEIVTTYRRKRDGIFGDYLSWRSNGSHNCDALHAAVLLTPLSAITDEDAIEIGRMVYADSVHNLDCIRDAKDWIAYELLGDALPSHRADQLGEFYDTDVFINVIDFLRSRGYALPWMGISVEDQISFGWVKLKQS